MGIQVGIKHHTSYDFDRLTVVHPHILRLRPAPHSRSSVMSYSLTVEPDDHFINWQQDPFGNHLARLVFPEPTRRLAFTVDMVVDLTVINPFDFFVEETAEHYPFDYDELTASELEPYLRVATEQSDALDAWLQGVVVPADGVAIVDFLVGLNSRLYNDIDYSIRMQPGVQSPQETFDLGIGSCRDTSWLLVEALRRLGLAARFVSGYLVQLTADQASLDGPSGPNADFTDLHAWAEVYIPGAGWVGLDPTSGLAAGEGHIPLACTPHPVSAAPVTGSTEQAEVTFGFSNEVTRFREDPRVTLPYSPSQWERIDAVGQHVDELLAAGDVRLTMGGEPTFVSIDDMEGDEWNTAADSEEKRELAQILARRIAKRVAPNGLLQHGQGKWYPGEPLPRWLIGIHWRTDGAPLWSNRALLADPTKPGTATKADAAAFANGLARCFGIDESFVIDAWNDPVGQVWHEARQPAGDPPELDATASEAEQLQDPAVRQQLLERLEHDETGPVGHVLPLHPAETGGRWQTSQWVMRRAKLMLVPGDSPIGLRLPLDSLTWPDPPAEPEKSTFAPAKELPAVNTLPQGTDVVEREDVPPTAVTVETRNQHIHVFLPPLEHVEHAIELLAAVELVAKEIGQPIVIEGYSLPGDPRLKTLNVTPDPGVIEVNVAPTSSWAELRDSTEALYEDARQARLGTEKFALDGTHTGTGGGNHVTLGGATPADSPMLRRPDLLRSMVTYWQHHPALSYLFSGQFIGPTSQAPRVDEGRADTMYELEIAFQELEAQGDEASPWIVDRLLRHLLVDLTGNTHRSEFCIDKLFSPDSERGRLGIVELRAFEMPPHPQMALVQALLVRALVARFWDDPYRGPLVRWGTELYDRFLLPHFVRSDMNDVIADLAAHGIEAEESWLDPFFEFRFPVIGDVTLGDVRIEIRNAIEPWHVLGEEVGQGGTARYVDSSVERLQVLVEGHNPARHIVTCNGIPVPLETTTTPGVAVAGVRFKAWAPWSALHPTIDVHGPLTFDLIDRWNGRSVGGCTYRVSHPGGRAYDTFPVNAAEAEARRSGRFEAHGHTPGRIDIDRLLQLQATRPVDYRRTLDLRRFRAKK